MFQEEGLSSDDVVSVMVLDSDVDNEVLVAGDSDGRLTIWSIDSYALFSKESSPPIRTLDNPCVPRGSAVPV